MENFPVLLKSLLRNENLLFIVKLDTGKADLEKGI